LEKKVEPQIASLVPRIAIDAHRVANVTSAILDTL